MSELKANESNDIETVLQQIQGPWDGAPSPAACILNAAQLSALFACARALVHADEEMKYFDEDAVCDHSVGVCWCDYLYTRDAMQSALKRLGELK